MKKFSHALVAVSLVLVLSSCGAGKNRPVATPAPAADKSKTETGAPETPAAPRTVTQPETKPEVKAEVKTEVKTDAKGATPPAVNPEPKKEEKTALPPVATPEPKTSVLTPVVEAPKEAPKATTPPAVTPAAPEEKKEAKEVKTDTPAPAPQAETTPAEPPMPNHDGMLFLAATQAQQDEYLAAWNEAQKAGDVDTMDALNQAAQSHFQAIADLICKDQGQEKATSYLTGLYDLSKAKTPSVEFAVFAEPNAVTTTPAVGGSDQPAPRPILITPIEVSEKNIPRVFSSVSCTK